MKSALYKYAILILSLFSVSFSSAQTISTFAGSVGSTSASGDGFSASAASIGTPNGVATDIYGNLYITDGNNNIIRKVDASGIITTIAGIAGASGYSGDGGPATNAHLGNPRGICVDGAGNIYFADNNNYIVRKIDASGNITTFAGTPMSSGFAGGGGPATDAVLDGAYDVTVDPSGNVYIADGGNKILIVDASGNLNVFAGGTTGYSGDGGPATAAAFNGTYGVSADLNNNIFVAESQNNIIREINNSGIVSTVAGYVDTTTYSGGYTGDGGPADSALLNFPSDLTLDSLGNIYIADAGNSVIRYVNIYTGNISTLAGNSYFGYAGDGGLADTATLNLPVDCAVNRYGYLFVADQRNDVIREVSPIPLIITTPTDTVCAGSPVTFTAVSGIAGTVHYHWLLDGSAVGIDSNTFVADSVHNGDSVACFITAGTILDTVGTAGPLYMATLANVAASISIATSAGDTLCPGVSATISSTSVNGGSAPRLVWYVNGTVVSSGTSDHYHYTPASGDSVVCRLSSSLECVLPRTVSSNSIRFTVLPVVSPSIAISTASDTVCTGSRVLFSAISAGGGTAPHYRWYVGTSLVATDTSSIVYTPSSGDAISCTFISNYPCAPSDTITSNTIVMHTTSTSVASVSIAVSGGDTTCGGIPVSITATPTNGGSSPSFVWYVNDHSAGLGATLSYTPTTGDFVRCTLISSLFCVAHDTVSSDSVKITVVPVAIPAITTTFSSDTVCHGTSVSFNATGINTGSAPVYNWYRNGTYYAVGSSFTLSSPVNGDSVYCVLYSNAACASPDSAISAVTHLVVNPLLTPSISISISPSDTICAGTSVTFHASTTNQGTTPSYLWYKNGIAVGTDSTYTSTILATGDVIKCRLTSNAVCAAPDTALSNSITITVHPLVTPAITISVSPSDTVCAGTRVTFSDTTTNPGTAPTYQWRKNGVNVATTTTYSTIPADGDVIKCILTSNATCAAPDTAASNSITITVNPIVTPAIIVSASPTGAVCAGTTVSFTTMIINGGAAPTYQWRVNGTVAGSGATSYSYTPSNGDSINCELTSNATCLAVDTAISRVVRMTVNPIVTPAVTISVSPRDTVCAGTAVTYSTSVTNGGIAPTFTWYKNGVAVGSGLSVYTDTPSVHDSVYCRVISDAPCTTVDTVYSNAIFVHITPLLSPSVTISTLHDTVCAGTLVTFNTAPVNGGTHPTFHWKVNSGYTDTGSTYTLMPVNGDMVKCIIISNYPCPSPDSTISDTITLRVNPVSHPTLSILTSLDTVCAGSAVVFVASADSAGTPPLYNWRVNGSGVSTSRTITYSPSATDIISCTLISTAVCSTPDTITDTAHLLVNPVNIDTVTITEVPGTTLYYGESVTFTAHPNHGGASPLYQWQVNGISVAATGSSYTTDTLTNGASVTCIVTGDEACLLHTSDVSAPTIITISNLSVPTINGANGTVTIQPNPNSGSFTVKGQFDGGNSNNATITVTDMLGKIIDVSNIPVTNGAMNSAISLNSGLASGMYLITISYDGYTTNMHFVIAK